MTARFPGAARRACARCPRAAVAAVLLGALGAVSAEKHADTDQEAILAHAEAVMEKAVDQALGTASEDERREEHDLQAVEAEARAAELKAAADEKLAVHVATEFKEETRAAEKAEDQAAREVKEAEQKLQYLREAAAAVEEETVQEEQRREEEAEAEKQVEEEEGSEKIEFTDIDLSIAVMLLGAIGFIMILFMLAHHPDPDMRYYCWSVLNRTISIFVAVLLFQGISKCLHSGIIDSFKDVPAWVHTVASFGEMIGFYILLQVMVACISGVCIHGNGCCGMGKVSGCIMSSVFHKHRWHEFRFNGRGPLGIQIGPVHGASGAMITHVVPDSWAFSKGIKEHDMLVLLGDTAVADMEQSEIEDMLKTDSHPYRFAIKQAINMDQFREQRELWMKCYATLVMHMTGFAAIGFGEAIIKAMEPFFARHPSCMFGVSLSMMVLQLSLAMILRALRVHTCSVQRKEVMEEEEESGERGPGSGYRTLQLNTVDHAAHSGHGHTETMDAQDREAENAYVLYDDEVYESENDICGLCVSFLLVEGCRFNIVGVFEVVGREQINAWSILYLVLIACLFAMSTVLSVVAYYKIPDIGKDGHKKGEWHSMLRRLVLIMQNTMATAFAWSMLGAAQWEVMRIRDYSWASGIGPPESSSFRVMLALVVSFVVFFTVRMLDKLADLDATGDTTDLAIFSIINSLGILVGFSWEQSFHISVEVIAEVMFSSKPLTGQLLLAVLVSLVSVVPWRNHILTKLLRLKKERLEYYGDKTTLLSQEQQNMDEIHAKIHGSMAPKH